MITYIKNIADGFIHVRHGETGRVVARFSYDVDGRRAYHGFVRGRHRSSSLYDADLQAFIKVFDVNVSDGAWENG